MRLITKYIMFKGFVVTLLSILLCQSSFADSVLKVHSSLQGYSVVDILSNKSVYNIVEASKAIQYAIDNTSKGRVVLSRGCFHINHPIHFKNNGHL